MPSLAPATRVFLALAPIDGRKGFNGVYTLVKETLQKEPTSGFWFVFLNRRRNRLEMLTDAGSGRWLLTKSLERGTLRRARRPGPGSRPAPRGFDVTPPGH